MKTFNDLTARKFGKWTVLKHLGTDNSSDRIWLCRCDCGLEKSVKAMYLLAGTSTKCVSCAQAKRPYTEIIPHVVWKRICNNANKRNIPLKITKKFAEKLFLTQNKKCALTGEELIFPEHGTGFLKGEYTASLDRIDSSKGYIKENVQWVHRDINMMKHVFSQDYFFKLCEKVLQHKRTQAVK